VVLEPGIPRCEGPCAPRVTQTPVSPSAAVYTNFTTPLASSAAEVAGGRLPPAATTRPLYLHAFPSVTVLLSTVTASTSASKTPHAQPLQQVCDAGAFTTTSTRVTGAIFGPFLGHSLQVALRRLQPGWGTAGYPLKFGFAFDLALFDHESVTGSTIASSKYPSLTFRLSLLTSSLYLATLANVTTIANATSIATPATSPVVEHPDELLPPLEQHEVDLQKLQREFYRTSLMQARKDSQARALVKQKSRARGKANWRQYLNKQRHDKVCAPSQHLQVTD
jgi:hypothetical protein